MKKDNISKAIARTCGMECAFHALAGAGTHPYDTDGKSIIPTEPQQGDWEYLEEKLHPWTITDLERGTFEIAYRQKIAEEQRENS